LEHVLVIPNAPRSLKTESILDHFSAVQVFIAEPGNVDIIPDGQSRDMRKRADASAADYSHLQTAFVHTPATVQANIGTIFSFSSQLRQRFFGGRVAAAVTEIMISA